jgi:hypothetical protein
MNPSPARIPVQHVWNPFLTDESASEPSASVDGRGKYRSTVFAHQYNAGSGSPISSIARWETVDARPKQQYAVRAAGTMNRTTDIRLWNGMSCRLTLQCS